MTDEAEAASFLQTESHESHERQQVEAMPWQFCGTIFLKGGTRRFKRIYSHSMGFYSDLIGFYSDLMGFIWIICDDDRNYVTLWSFSIAIEHGHRHTFII